MYFAGSTLPPGKKNLRVLEEVGCWVLLIQTDGLWRRVLRTTHMCNPDLSHPPNLHQGGERPKISLPVSLYLLSQVFLIIHHAPLVNSLAEVILNGDLSETYAKPEQDVQRSCVSH